MDNVDEELKMMGKKQRWWVPIKDENDPLGPVVMYEVEAQTLDEAQELVAAGEGELVSEPEEIDSGEPSSAYVNQDPDLR